VSERRLSLRTRLLFLQVAVFGGLLLATAPAAYIVMSRTLQRDRDTYLTNLARTTVEEWRLRSAPGLVGPAQPSLCLPEPVPPQSAASDATHRPRHLLVWDGERVVCSDGETAPLAPQAVAQALATGTPAFADVRWSAEVLRIVAWPTRSADQRAVVVEVGTSYRVIEGAIGESLMVTIAIEVTALVLLVAGSWVLTRRAFMPIDRIVERLEDIDEDTLSERLPNEPTEDQAARLVVVINRMLTRLERAFVAQSRFSSDVAHEIRSPLTALRGQIEVALRKERPGTEYRQTLADCLDEVLRLTRLTEDLMSLARSDAGELQMRYSRVDLGELLSEVCRRCRPRAAEKDVGLMVKISEPVVIDGDADLLIRCVANLVDNALIHSPRLEEVVLALERGLRGAVIAVIDHGAGISEEHVPRIFDRFYRVDPARSRERGGAGLGLAIVKQIVTLHGGQIDVSSTVGVGSIFKVTLPFTRPPLMKVF
jgi:two-component system OmpR family sensor kinase